MIDKLFIIFRKVLASAESDRYDAKFNRLDSKVDNLDMRMDGLAISQAQQNEKLAAIHQITLANNETLEQKINFNNATSQNTKDLSEIRFASFSESFKRLEALVLQVVKRDCNPR